MIGAYISAELFEILLACNAPFVKGHQVLANEFAEVAGDGIANLFVDICH